MGNAAVDMEIETERPILNAVEAEELEIQEEDEDEELKRWEMQQIKKGNGYY